MQNILRIKKIFLNGFSIEGKNMQINPNEMIEDTVFIKKRNRTLIKKKSGLTKDERRKKWNNLMKQNPRIKELINE